jgi:hypothetical protein
MPTLNPAFLLPAYVVVLRWEKWQINDVSNCQKMFDNMECYIWECLKGFYFVSIETNTVDLTLNYYCDDLLKQKPFMFICFNWNYNYKFYVSEILQ